MSYPIFSISKISNFKITEETNNCIDGEITIDMARILFCYMKKSEKFAPISFPYEHKFAFCEKLGKNYLYQVGLVIKKKIVENSK